MPNGHDWIARVTLLRIQPQRRCALRCSLRRAIGRGFLFSVAVFEGEQKPFRKPKRADDEDDRQRHPQNDVHPEWGVRTEFSGDRQRDDDAPDDHDQQGRGAVTDIEPGVIEAASRTARREAHPASEPTIQRMESSKDIIRGNVESLMKLIAAFDRADIEFIAEGAVSQGGGRGVRFKALAGTGGSGPSVPIGSRLA